MEPPHRHMPQTPEEQRKCQQSASPEKQRGISSHNKKRQHIKVNQLHSDMEEYKNKTMSILSPLTFLNLLISATPFQDIDGDTTMVGQTLLCTPSKAEEELQGSTKGHMTPVPKTKQDLVWILKRTRKEPDSPSFTQDTQSKSLLGIYSLLCSFQNH